MGEFMRSCGVRVDSKRFQLVLACVSRRLCGLAGLFAERFACLAHNCILAFGARDECGENCPNGKTASKCGKGILFNSARSAVHSPPRILAGHSSSCGRLGLSNFRGLFRLGSARGEFSTSLLAGFGKA